jgi:prevent-host-death family protein
MTTTTVTIRDLQRKQRHILEHIARTRQPAIILNNNIPQAAIISLEDYEELQRIRLYKGLEELQSLARRITEEHKDEPLPSDMSTNHNAYLAGTVQEDLERIHKHYDNSH